MVARDLNMSPAGSNPPVRHRGIFNSIKFFVFCHSLLQLAQLLVSGYMKSSISTIERRYGLSSQKSGLLAAFNEVGNTVFIIFVSFLGSRVHRPRFIGGGALLACVASLLMALPHFVFGPYKYSHHVASSKDNSSGLCQTGSSATPLSSNQSCSEQEDQAQQGVYLLLLLAQLLLGIAAVPIQPFGISYIDDYASKKNSPLYLGILLAMTSIGPALGFVSGAAMLRFYVDFNKLSKDQIQLDNSDLRWVGAWWLGFLAASCLLFLAALPYFFFPRNMAKEEGASDVQSSPDNQQQQPDELQELSLFQFLKSFPRIVLRMLKSPIYLLVVLAQVNLAALLAGLATFMAKFIERQFNRTVSFSNMMIGSVGIPMAVLGTVLGGVLMRRLGLSVSGASRLCAAAVLLCLLSAFPLLLVGCSTQQVAGIFPRSPDAAQCTSDCHCSHEAFNPVCGTDGVEFRSPCHAGCKAMEMDGSSRVRNYTQCACVGGLSHASPGTCGSGCSHLLHPFLLLLGLTAFIAAFSQTPSCMMILRTVTPEDKSFAVGIQYMLFRVLAFMPGPVLYGSVIDTTCILWAQKCGKPTSCLYYDLDHFRQRFLGLMVVFVCGALLCFLLTVRVLRGSAGQQEPQPEDKGPYRLVDGSKTLEDAPSKEKETMATET
ncbi:solute carrier organic anion transporter family member 2B1 [Betta splendens]|uniref:Solute carrier organic anion transporter family member n=1 Tax=Betta splendens TaxID=158456 RepID=A0A6P7PPT4_BETSP|nr:solute carrier organic anion transporter family member 2B1 [Betta splendens]XP_029029214.1 solute carrier organic anion transporter family member 2B1 [Betta splendens]